MEIERLNREIPDRLKEESARLDIEGLIALYTGDYSKAKTLFQRQYELFLNAQKEENRPIHKGSALYNLGRALFFLGEVDESIHHFLLAYVEDTLNMDYDFEDDADRLPAAHMLREIFLFRLKILREIKAASAKIKEKGLWNEIRDPADLLQNVAKSLKLNIHKLSNVCGRIPEVGKMVVGFPQPRDLRVFIGTNYDVNIGVIPLVKEGIFRKARGYVPVSVMDVVVPPNATHDISLLLLHTCKYAIIDVTHPGGQFVEIERARDYGVEVLLVRQAAKPIDPKKPPHISEMISTLGYPIEYYFDPRELIQITMNFLP
jgi:tetratricopeptide (TPR) repeat protein